MIKSPFSSFVGKLHSEGKSLQDILTAAQQKFGAHVCLHQVERSIELFKQGLVEKDA